MTFSFFLPALAGGALIGLSASLVLWSHGRRAGISGILDRAFSLRSSGAAFSIWFLSGLALGGLLLSWLSPEVFGASPPVALPGLLLAGLAVGFGTRVSGGCTSGHGVCGLGRFSLRSLVAVVTFMTTGALTLLAAHHGLGVAP